MPLQNWTRTKTRLTGTLDGAFQTSFIKRWSPNLYNDSAVVTFQPYKTGDISSPVTCIVNGDTSIEVITTEVQVYKTPIENLLNWVQTFRGELESQASPRDMLRMYNELDKLIREEKFTILDTLISSLPKLDMSYEVKCAALRYTFPIRGKLNTWKSSVSAVYKDLETLGLHPKEVMAGLI